MAKKPEITLNTIRNSPKLTGSGKVSRVSDFVSKSDLGKLRQSNARGKRSARQFNDADSYVAEMIARFGYDAYRAWDDGLIDDRKMRRLIYAERAREKAFIYPLETIITLLVRDCIKRTKKEPKAKGPKEVAKILRDELKKARGEM